MNKTRFQLPPRPDAAVGVDRWVTGGTAVAAPWHTATATAAASDRSKETPASLKFPFIFDAAALLAAQRRNIEAITAANRVLVEGAQAVVRRNLEILYQTFDSMPERVEAIGDWECPRDRAMQQTETAIKAFEDASDNMRELGRMIQHANGEAMEVLTKRFTEAADEMKSLARSTARNFWESETKPAPFWQQT
jgi:phasin family protein